MFGLKQKNNKCIIPYIETHLVDHCNLKCDKCGHFCHLIDEDIYTDLSQFKKDLSVLSKKIKLYHLCLLGGEPLLHPQINDFLRVSRKYFPNSVISILTNGILLPKMNKTFWDTVRETNTSISLSKYPVLGNKFSELLDLIDDNNVKLGHISLAKKFYDKLNVDGTSNEIESFKVCASNHAVNLWRQKLYTCQACYRYYYNEKTNSHLELPDGVDIYKATPEEIHNTLYKPNIGCKFCNVKSEVIPWHFYQKDN